METDCDFRLGGPSRHRLSVYKERPITIIWARLALYI